VRRRLQRLNEAQTSIGSLKTSFSKNKTPQQEVAVKNVFIFD
jgi:hypothetical protein